MTKEVVFRQGTLTYAISRNNDPRAAFKFAWAATQLKFRSGNLKYQTERRGGA